MALRIEYVTPYGITCNQAHCVIIGTRCDREKIEDEMKERDGESKEKDLEEVGGAGPSFIIWPLRLGVQVSRV